MRNPAAKGERDANHGELAQVYRSLGCSIVDTHELGFGFPDAVIGCVGVTELVEFKTADGVPTAAQVTFNRDWRGSRVRVVRCQADVVDHVQSIRQRFSGRVVTRE